MRSNMIHISPFLQFK